ncbi:tail length tape measure protein [Achromobacter phage 83-24]|uniref:Tape measure domain protein n=1 Tax=Achromobacter phage 83-24 TaxID=1589747 RepID=A0A0B4ZZH0_9CAUD|nr:tail length tape measure protein [Achromobacter phage 83-24]AJD82852.1 tape measure domain protein [Achromobacter phage 83-24]
MNEELHVEVTERGAREVSRNISDIGTAATGALNPLKNLERLLAGFVSLQALQSLSKTLDTYTEMQNRIKTLVGATGDYNGVLQRLANISASTRSSLKDNVLLFQRMGLAQNELNASTNELFKVSETVAQAIAIQGGSAATTSGAVLQLSQAFGSGRVQLEEFNSVITGLYPVAQAAAKGIDAAGGSIAKLRRLIADGQINSRDLFQGILKGAEDMRGQFEQTVPTVSQAFQVLRDRVMVYLGTLNDAIDGSETFARYVLTLSTNLESLAKGVTVLAVALGPAALAGALALVNSLLARMSLIIMAHPILALASLIAGSVAAITLFGKKMNDLTNVIDSNASVLERLVATFDGAQAYIKAAWENFPLWFGNIIRSAINYALEAINEGANSLQRSMKEDLDMSEKIFGALGLGEWAAARRAKYEAAANDSIQKGFRLTNPIPLLPENNDAFAKAGNAADEAFNQAYMQSLYDSQKRRQFVGEQADLDARSNRPMEPFSSKGNGKGRKKELSDIIDLLEQQERGLQMEADARERLNQINQFDRQVKGGLGQTEKEMLDRKLQFIQVLEREANLYSEIRGPQEDFQKNYDALNQLLSQGKINAEEYNKKLNEMRISMLELDRSMEGGVKLGVMKLAEEFTNLGSLLSDTIVRSFKSAEDAFVQFVSTGKLEFSSLVDSIVQDLVRLAVRQSITGPIAGILGNAIGGWLGGGGGSSVNVVGGGIGGGAGSMTAAQWGGSFATGGNFRVMGAGGVDSQMVSFMATPGEEVYVRRPGEGLESGGGSAVIYSPITVVNNASDKVQVNAQQEQDGDGNTTTTFTIDYLEQQLAGRMSSGRGPLHRSTQNAFGLNSAPRG